MYFWVRSFFIYFIVLFITSSCDGFDYKCRTWDGSYGVCVEKSVCKGFEEAFNRNETFVSETMSNSGCFEYDPDKVCCGLAEGKLIFPSISKLFPVVHKTKTKSPPRVQTVSYEDVVEKYNSLVNSSRLFATNRCGKQQADNPVLFANCTPLVEFDEFPWLVHISTKNSTDFVCTGILINYDTVLSTYVCAVNAEKVRIGVYRLNEDRVCVPTSPKDNSLSCPGAVVQRDFNLIKNPDIPELGILKLKPRVRYDDIIRPICLPIVEDARFKEDQLLFLSGWNLLNDEGSEFIKYKLAYRANEDKKCENMAVDSMEETFCMVGVHNFTENPSLKEARGPVTYQYGFNWYLAGFQWQTRQLDMKSNTEDGTQVLGITLTPSIFNWILDNITPP